MAGERREIIPFIIYSIFLQQYTTFYDFPILITQNMNKNSSCIDRVLFSNGLIISSNG